MINRTDLPGAILFPSIKYKEIWVEVPTEPTADVDSDATLNAVNAVKEGDKTSTSATVPVPASASASANPTSAAAEGVSSAVTTSEGESPEKPVVAESDSAITNAAEVADNSGMCCFYS